MRWSIRWSMAAVSMLSVAVATAIGFGMLALHPLSWSHPVRVVTVSESSTEFSDWPIPETSTVQTQRIDPSDAATDEFADRLGDSNGNHPLIVRLSGVLDVSGNHAQVWPVIDEASSTVINCSRLVDRLRSRTGPTLLYIEARLAERLRQNQFPEADAWSFQQLIERQLTDKTADRLSNRSLSVVMDFRSLLSSVIRPANESWKPKDANGNGMWECSDWLSPLRERPSHPTNVAMASRFAWTPEGSRRWDFPIMPMSVVSNGDMVGGDTTTLTARSVQLKKSAVDAEPSNPATGTASLASATSPPVVEMIDTRAPSMAMAAWSQTTSWPTRDATTATELSSSWYATLHHASGEKAVNLWLTTHAEAANQWREYRWASRVVKQPLPWSARRDLLLCNHDIETLMTNAFVRRPFRARWDKLRQRWNELQRKGMFDDISEPKTSTIDPAECRQLRMTAQELRADCDTLRKAHESVEDFDAEASRWVNFPVPPRTKSVSASGSASASASASASGSSLDSGCDVLAAAVVLKSLVCQPELEDCRGVEIAHSEWKHRLKHAENAIAHSRPHETINVPSATACREQRYHLVSQWRALQPSPMHPVTKARIADTLNNIAADLSSDLRGATMAQRADGRENLQQLGQWLERLGSTSRIDLPRPIELTSQGSEGLIQKDEAVVRLTARVSDGEPLQGTWSFETDPSFWEIIPMPGRSTERITGGPNTLSAVEVRLRKRALPTSPQWLRCAFHTESDGYQLIVPLQTAMAPFAQVDWPHADPTRLLPNATVPIPMRLQSLDRTCKRAAVRLLALNEPSATSIIEAPQGSFVGIAATKFAWDQSTAGVLAEVESVSLSPDQMTTVAFPPTKIDPTKPVIDAQWMRLEIRDLDTDRVQYIDLRPAAGRPMGWLNPQVRFDRQANKITVATNWIADENTDAASDADRAFRVGATLRARLIDLESDQVISQGSVVCNGTDWPTLALSSSATERTCELVIDALGWQDAFHYRIDPQVTDGDVFMSRQIQGIAWSDSVATGERFGVSATATSVAVNVRMTDGEFAYGQDEIAVGIDRNQNRYLENNEILGSANSPVRTQFDWAGVDEHGHVRIRNRVAAQHFDVPLTQDKNQHIDLLAQYRRGTQVWRTQPATLVVDHQPPRITKSVPSAGGPYESSLPITFLIEADDNGLSGVQRVEAGWAIEGRLEFSPDVKPLPAGHQPDGRWTVTLPTKDLPTGNAVAMIRAVDRVENVSEIATVNIDLQTAAEVAAFRNRPTSSLQGRVLYVTLPVAEMKVRLQRRVEAKDATSLPPIEVVTDQAGRFVSPKVVPGKYDVIVSGLYRGVRREESVTVEVPGHQMVQIPDIQIR